MSLDQSGCILVQLLLDTKWIPNHFFFPISIPNSDYDWSDYDLISDRINEQAIDRQSSLLWFGCLHFHPHLSDTLPFHTSWLAHNNLFQSYRSSLLARSSESLPKIEGKRTGNPKFVAWQWPQSNARNTSWGGFSTEPNTGGKPWEITDRFSDLYSSSRASVYGMWICTSCHMIGFTDEQMGWSHSAKMGRVSEY